MQKRKNPPRDRLHRSQHTNDTFNKSPGKHLNQTGTSFSFRNICNNLRYNSQFTILVTPCCTHVWQARLIVLANRHRKRRAPGHDRRFIFQFSGGWKISARVMFTITTTESYVLGVTRVVVAPRSPPWLHFCKTYGSAMEMGSMPKGCNADPKLGKIHVLSVTRL